MEPKTPIPEAMFEAIPRSGGMAGVAPLSARGGAVNLRPAVLASGGVLVLVAGALAYWSSSQDVVPGPGVGVSSDHQRLVALMRSERPFEPRLAGGFDYAACEPSPGNVTGLLPGPGCRRDRLRPETVRRLSGSRPGFAITSDRRVRGLWRLIWESGSETAVRAAVQDLRSAAEDSAGADTWNDLAAALVVLARSTQDPAHLVEALDGVSQSLALAPWMLEALFNHALILQDLGLDREARNAWEVYLEHDPASGWAGEARRQLTAARRPEGVGPLLQRLARGDGNAISAAIVGDSAAVRRLALDQSLATWGVAVERGDQAEAVRQLRHLQRIGAELRSRTGDHSVAAATAAIERAPHLATLARAHRRFAEGRTLMGQSRYEQAIFRLEASRQDFLAAGSPMDGWAELWLAVCDSSTNRWHRTLRRVSSIQARQDLADMPALDARSRWARGLIQLRVGAYESSLNSFSSAARLFAAMGEGSLAASANALMAESYRVLGRSREAWTQRVTALRALRPSATTSLHNLLLDASIAAREEGFLHAAVAFQSFDVERSSRLGSSSRLIEALLLRSRAWSSLGLEGRSRRDLDAAWVALGDVEDPGLQRRLTAHLEEAEAHHLGDANPTAALDHLERAIRFRRELSYKLDSASVLQNRAQLHLRLGDVKEAKADLQAAVRTYERPDLQPLGNLFRREHFERAQEAFEALIEISLESGDPWEALALSERARLAAVRRSTVAQRRLTGARTDRPPAPVDAEGLRRWARRQPSDTVFLSYWMFGDHLLTWKIKDGQLEHWRQPVSHATLRGWVARLTTSLEKRSDPEAVREFSGRLHHVLLGRALQSVASGHHLVIVADRELTKVPFLALRPRQGDSHLVEDHSVVMALSLGRSSGRMPVSTTSAPLVVGDPAHPDLPRLASAAVEAREVASLYGSTLHLEGEAAHRRALLAHLPAATLFHYSGHGRDRAGWLWESHFALAPTTEGGDSLVAARDLLGLDLSRLGLAVLAGCSTGGGRAERASPLSGLTLALLEAGTTHVLSTLWDIEDDTTRKYLVSFHREVAAGAPPETALRAAILGELGTGGADAAHWAPLVLYRQFD